MLRRLIGEHIELATDLEPAGAPVKADPGLMLQLLMNLAVNARDAMPQGGLVRLAGRNLDGVRDKGVALAGPYVALTVADTGIGISP